jgi:5-methylcytosine-specific restriction endonuclease McrA
MQAYLFANTCPCLQRTVAIAGLCRICYTRRYRSKRFFGGHRDTVLRRDHACCRGCGRREQIVVHHREPGKHQAAKLITLCASCHARVHRSYVLRHWVEESVAQLWRELHPQSPEQLRFALKAFAQAA